MAERFDGRRRKTMLKLGKGSAFVKSRLGRINQNEDAWEVDFQPVPCPKGGHDHGAVPA